MYILIFGKGFTVSVKKLDKIIRIKLEKLLKIFSQEPFHPILRSKPLTGKLAGFYSFRIDRNYRVIFQFAKEKVIIMLRAKHRKDVYKNLP